MTHDPAATRPTLRLWPGLVLVALTWLVRFALPVVAPNALMYAVLGGIGGGLLVLLWWLFASRAPWRDRLLGAALFGAAMVGAPLAGGLLDPSIAGGMMGLMFAIYAAPALALALVGWAAWSQSRRSQARWVSAVVAFALAILPFTLIRTEGMSGDADSDFHWRWTPTLEERLLAADREEPKPLPQVEAAAPAAVDPAPPTQAEPDASAIEPIELLEPTQAAAAADTTPAPIDPAAIAASPAPSPAEWPGFRGPNRDSVVRGVRIGVDWGARPPVEVWRRPVGPGWGSFAVAGNLIYTQEQRGDDEAISCYRLDTGELVWRHTDPERFWESNAGAGPRSTPTLAGDVVVTLGATGLVNALDARTGVERWSRNAAADTGAELPGWGFSGSPLVLGDTVIIAAAGTMIAYDLASGEPRWTGPDGGGGYSSPQQFSIAGIDQVLLLGQSGSHSVTAADGAVLWSMGKARGSQIVQPALAADGSLLIADGDTSPLRRYAVSNDGGGWTTAEAWSTMGLKPYFSDFVVHQTHAYGFDGNMLAAVDLETGAKAWKGGRYGHGQLLLLADQDLLLVLSEKGELALARATPSSFEELGRVPAITGKTWNHPVVVGDLVLVRNATEMAAFRLPVE